MTKEKEILLKKLRGYLIVLYLLAVFSFLGMLILQRYELGSVAGSIVLISLPIILFMEKIKRGEKKNDDGNID